MKPVKIQEYWKEYGNCQCCEWAVLQIHMMIKYYML